MNRLVASPIVAGTAGVLFLAASIVNFAYGSDAPRYATSLRVSTAKPTMQPQTKLGPTIPPSPWEDEEKGKLTPARP